ncbi:MAG TPA: 3-deoxy-manno-octulosonate cytidylyltransferase [Candidatus Dormibacteraeota bacterium]|nr:3-deoxy-manno-octulosonate cytidylyltransferase [Candidatus Dormibacteraeota bacterium]
MNATPLPRALVVIPARYNSTRFPGKVLADLNGKPMIERVVERARQARAVERVLVATDDERVAGAVAAFGGEAVMTRPDHRSGTGRLAEVATKVDAPIFVNVQGDEPLIEPAAIDTAVETLAADPTVAIATLATPILEPGPLADPNVVKVVMDFESDALYFSRAPIPWLRDTSEETPRYFKHIGLYVFRREALLEFPTLPPGELERVEQLEQLRWLENGYRIRVAITNYDSIAVDVPEDIARVTARLSSTGQ